jgi:glycosyltransferase involved in cell wall biosynthesis
MVGRLATFFGDAPSCLLSWMKLGLIVYGSLETVSGGYLYDRKLVEYLRRQGDQVDIYSMPWRNYLRCLADNIMETGRALRRRLDAAALDILLQDELNHPSLFWLNRHLHLPAPRIAIVHHLRINEPEAAQPWKKSLYRWVERAFLQSVNGFVFNSQSTATAVNRLLSGGVRPAVIAWPAGDRFNPQITSAEIIARAQAPGPLRLVFLGNLIPRKGLHILLEALQRLPAGYFKLAVIGSPAVDPGYAMRVQQVAGRAASQADVCFTGALTDETLAAELRRAHLLVVPSFYEGYGIAYLEGMGFGLPAIAGQPGAPGEIITHGRDGYLVPAGDSQALAEILVELHDDRRRLVELSLAARQRFLAQPGWDETGRLIRQFLETMI